MSWGRNCQKSYMDIQGIIFFCLFSDKLSFVFLHHPQRSNVKTTDNHFLIAEKGNTEGH